MTDSHEEHRNNIATHGIKYLLVGGSSTVIEVVVFQLLLSLTPAGVAPSNIIALVVSTGFNFALNRNFTFRSSTNPFRSLVLYLILFAFNTLFTTVLLSILIDDLGWKAVLAKLLGIACTTLWNFVLYRTVIFK